MVARLLINNFQSHEKTDIRFSPGVNIIVGSTDSGKSSILRALRMLVLNRPSGDAMRSWWGGETSVLVEFVEGAVVERVKGTAEIYRVNGQEFKAFRTNIPDEVQDTVNLNDDNFQNQLDPPFLLSNTAGEVASFFNRIAKIDKIDSSLKAVQSWLNQLIQQYRFKSDYIEEKQKELTTFDFLEGLENAVEVIEGMEQVSVTFARKQRDLTNQLTDIHELENKIEDLSGLLSMGKRVDMILKMVEVLNDMDAMYVAFSGDYKLAVSLENSINQKSAVLRMESLVSDTLVLLGQRNAVNVAENGIKTDLTRYEDAGVSLKVAERAVRMYENEFSTVFPDICPLCGTIQNKK